VDISPCVFHSLPSIATMDEELVKINARLRSIRRSKGFTLADIERLSQGNLRAISLGSYERGDRELSLKKAIQIADFYEVPLGYVLTGKSEVQAQSEKTVIDLRQLKTLTRESEKSLTLQIIFSFISGIIKARQDFNGEILSLRDKDCEYLTISIGCSYQELRQFLQSQHLLVTTK
jgi:transcriptional regulator with XRE-family HTH domain